MTRNNYFALIRQNSHTGFTHFYNTEDGASDAWEMWLKLNELADSLWDNYEKDFIEYCLIDSENKSSMENYLSVNMENTEFPF